MSDDTNDNVTTKPESFKGSPAQAAFKKIIDAKRKAIQERSKKAVEEYIAAEKIAQIAKEKVLELEIENRDLDKENLTL